MNEILIPTLLVAALGLVFAVILTIASKIFYVHVDETVQNVRAELPGANCGACGYAGCDQYAKALAADPSIGTGKCLVGGDPLSEVLAGILGVEAEDSIESVAVVGCTGNNCAVKPMMEYQGVSSCAAAKQLFGGFSSCKYGCLGLGDCVNACQYNAIHICDGVAVVDRTACKGCGMCAKVCPGKIIKVVPDTYKVLVNCSNPENGAKVRKVCENGCIGCKKCEKTCKFDAIHVENNLAVIDYEKCKNCGACAKECPTGAIVNTKAKRKTAAAS